MRPCPTPCGIGLTDDVQGPDFVGLLGGGNSLAFRRFAEFCRERLTLLARLPWRSSLRLLPGATTAKRSTERALTGPWFRLWTRRTLGSVEADAYKCESLMPEFERWCVDAEPTGGGDVGQSE